MRIGLKTSESDHHRQECILVVAARRLGHLEPKEALEETENSRKLEELMVVVAVADYRDMK